MKKIKSGCTYFRRQLKIKGRTEHSGRGFYDLEYNCSYDELKRRVEEMIDKHPERYNVDRSEHGMEVKIKPKLMEARHYYTLFLSIYTGALSVGM